MLQEGMVYAIVTLVAFGLGVVVALKLINKGLQASGWVFLDSFACCECSANIKNYPGGAMLHESQLGVVYCSARCHRAHLDKQERAFRDLRNLIETQP